MSWHTPSTDLGTHICIKLINLVKKHPVIYKSSRKSAPHSRKNRNEINQIWEDIAGDIGLSVEDSKRRWKGLKDVFAKIRKRRLQEGVLGIKARKKWLYEDEMSFMKFPFEQPYQKALENFEEIDCNDWKLEDQESNDTGEETLTDSHDHLVLNDENTEEQSMIEEQEQIEDGTIEYLELDLEVDSVPDSEGYESIQSSEKEGRHGADCSYDKTCSQNVEMEKISSYSTKTKTQSKYRAIRPKPYQPNMLSENRSFSKENIVKNGTGRTPPIVKVSNLSPSNQMIVTTPTALRKANNCDMVILATPNIKVEDHSKEVSDGVSSTSPAGMKLESFKNTRMDSSLVTNKNDSLLHVSSKKSGSSSLELFFESMAQTVMNLPMRAQAEIKMEICKVVTRAEIQYSLSQTASKLEFRKSIGKKI